MMNGANFVENGIMYRMEKGKKQVICLNANCGDNQVPDHSCWTYSEPTPYPGEERNCKIYVFPDFSKHKPCRICAPGKETA
jgi:hypothetical protein